MILNIDPTLPDLGPLEIRCYGVFLPWVTALSQLCTEALAQNKSPPSSTDAGDLLVIGLVGAVSGYCFYELDYYLANPGQI